jgi:hypothetical protein
MKLWACVDSEDHATYKSIIRSESPPEMTEDGWNLDKDCIIGEIDGDSVTALACRDLLPGTCQEIARLDLIKWEVERVGPVLDGKPKPVPACPVLAEKGDEFIVVIKPDGSWRRYPFMPMSGTCDRLVGDYLCDISGPPGSWPSASEV